MYVYLWWCLKPTFTCNTDPVSVTTMGPKMASVTLSRGNVCARKMYRERSVDSVRVATLDCLVNLKRDAYLAHATVVASVT